MPKRAMSRPPPAGDAGVGNLVTAYFLIVSTQTTLLDFSRTAGAGALKVTELGIMAYLRTIAVRCERLALRIREDEAKDELRAISADLIDKAAVLEATFRVEKRR